MKKRPLKKSKKKALAKKAPARKARAKKTSAKPQKPIGVVTHFYTKIRVAIVKFNKKVPAGAKLRYKGATTDFVDVAKSMQYNRVEIKAAPKGKQIGIKVKKRVREGDLVRIAE